MTVKNREWVKSAAIVFLSVLLVLTLFSNTILNYSLPEVAGDYARSGEIKTAIRGQGTVTANMSYKVELGETRQIASVLVSRGDYIEAGQVLFTLEEGSSEELKAAQKTLDGLLLAYNRKLLEMKPADYDDQNREIAYMQEELQELADQKDKIAVFAQALEAANAQVKAAQTTVTALERQQADIEAAIANLGSTDEYDYQKLLTDQLKKLQTAITEAADAEAAAQKAVDKAQEELDNNSKSSNGSSASAIQSQISSKQAVLSSLKVSVEQLKQTIILLVEGDGGYTAYENAKTAYLGDTTDAALKAAYDTEIRKLLAPSSHTDPTIKEMATTYQTTLSDISITETEIQNLETDYRDAVNSSSSDTTYQKKLTAAKEKLSAAKDETAAAKKAFSNGMKDLTASYKDSLSAKKDEVAAAKEVLDEAKAAQTEAAGNASVKPEELDKQIKAKQREIETKLNALADQKDDNRITAAVAALDLENERKVIEEQQAEVDRLSGKTEGAEVKARYGGQITSVSAIAGEKIQAGAELASIDVEGKGFTTSFAVTNEQAQKVRIGDTTTITSWWGPGVVATLTAIKPDTSNPGRSKILEFNLEGDVTVGQTLNISIGERNQSYNCVLPNSAIREDSNGKFILIAKHKSTPLGTRYIATRIDVSVLASDDTNTAISQDNYDYDFVITTTTKPVEPGMQVRLINS